MTQTDSLRYRAALNRQAPLLITLGAGLIVYGLLYDRGIWLSVVGYSISPAERVLNGETPYRDFLFNYTPGMLWLNAALMRLFGSALMPIQVGLFAFKLSALLMLYWLGKRLVSPWAALVPVGLTLCWLGHRYIFNVHPAQYSILFVLAAIVFMLWFDDTGDVRWLVASGLMIGLVFVFKYNVGLILLGTGSAAIIAMVVVPGWARSGAGPGAALGRVAAYWLGFGVVAMAMCGYLAARGALAPMFDHFLHHAADYSEERSVGLPSWRLLLPAVTGLLTATIGLEIVKSVARRLLLPATCVFAAIGGALVMIPGRPGILKDAATAAVAYFPAFTFLASFFWIVFRVIDRSDKGDQEPMHRERRLMIVACLALGAYLEVYPRADYYHLVRVLPPVFMLFTVLLSCVSLWAPRGTSSARSAQQAMIGLAPLLVLMLSFTGIKDTWLPQFDGWFRLADNTAVAIPRANGIKVSGYEAGMIGDLTRLIESNSSPGDSIFSFARRGAGFYFFADRRNPTRLLWWDSVGIKAADRTAVLDMLNARLPRLILIQMALDDPQVRTIVNENYQRLGAVEDIEVFIENGAATPGRY
jgi:hypothetical protein